MKNVFLPLSLAELWSYMQKEPEALLYAGGTDLLVKMRRGLPESSSLICLERVPELRTVTDEEDEVHIGACATHSALLKSPPVRAHFPVLVQALEGLGSPLVRNMGTIGGNICTASPAGDTLPPLYVLGAEVELMGAGGARRMPIRDFITGPGRTRLGKGEVLAAVHIKKAHECNVHHFEKVGQRNALACSLTSLAALLLLNPEGVVQSASLAWGSVGPTVVMCPEAEALLVGRELSLKSLGEAVRAATKAVSPISDVRAEADYRRFVAGNLLLRLLLYRKEAG